MDIIFGKQSEFIEELSNYTLKQQLFGDSVEDRFGQSVATSKDGKVLIMGGYRDDPNNIFDAGSAIVYTGNATNGWFFKQLISGDSEGDQFGYSVATNEDGTLLMVGGRFDDPNNIFDAGSVLIYTGNAIDGWILKQHLAGEHPIDYFGKSVATSNDGTILMVGAPADDVIGVPITLIDVGSAFIYTGNPANGWALKQRLTGDSAANQFGTSVAMSTSGDILIMGGFQDNDGGTRAGAANVYTGNAANGWQLRQKLLGDSESDNFGTSVAASADGNIIIMGGIGDDDGASNAGAAMVYTGNATNGWQLRQKLLGDSVNDYFGTSVAMNEDGSVLIMGGTSDDDGGINAGAALIYTGNAIDGWGIKQKITGNSASDFYGESVAINSNGTVLMMGGTRDDPYGITNAGAALIYTNEIITPKTQTEIKFVSQDAQFIEPEPEIIFELQKNQNLIQELINFGSDTTALFDLYGGSNYNGDFFTITQYQNYTELAGSIEPTNIETETYYLWAGLLTKNYDNINNFGLRIAVLDSGFTPSQTRPVIPGEGGPQPINFLFDFMDLDENALATYSGLISGVLESPAIVNLIPINVNNSINNVDYYRFRPQSSHIGALVRLYDLVGL